MIMLVFGPAIIEYSSFVSPFAICACCIRTPCPDTLAMISLFPKKPPTSAVRESWRPRTL